MAAKEDVRDLLLKRPFERAAFHDHLWRDTLERWVSEGYPTEDRRPVEVGDHFGFDVVMFGGIDPRRAVRRLHLRLRSLCLRQCRLPGLRLCR